MKSIRQIADSFVFNAGIFFFIIICPEFLINIA